MLPTCHVVVRAACGVPELGHQRLTWSLGGWFVFVDQTAEHGSALGPCCWGIGAEVIRPWRLEVERAVRGVDRGSGVGTEPERHVNALHR